MKLPPLGASREGFLRRLKSLKPRRIQGRFFRLVLSLHADAISETGPSFVNGGRFNSPDEFGALYLSDQPETAWKETVKKYNHRPQDIPPQALGIFEVDISKGLDLTNEKTLKTLGVTKEDITQPGDHYLTQMIASAAWSVGIEAIQFPSSIDPARFNIAVFTDHLTPPSRLIPPTKTSHYP